MSHRPSLAVIGLGLIGGSLARALRVAGAVSRISGYDPDQLQRRLAVDLGVVDLAADSAAEAVRAADLVVLAVPVLRTAEAMAAVLPALKAGAIVTDVGSTKQSVLADVARTCGELPSWFVAAHPIAGTEKSGVAASNAELFRNKRLILTPHPRQDPAAFATVRALWEAVGARVVEMDAARHDAIFAATSHLPHVLAYAFVNMLSRLDGEAEIFANAGGGFRDFTRIASSSPQMWHDIVRANRESVSGLLEQQIVELQELLALMRAEHWDELKARFQRARDARERHLSHIE
ncbi:MAG: prephenate dehydrogenase/arogenate dehydrogenase family protein [Stagnimonas sp.]|nr:prephenate dehydrogenase/arogenate dehydrogenase family protein [Stagnimonas sp.]